MTYEETRQINTPQELLEFQNKFGLRPSWHEPDEQGINVRVTGTHLDNAMGHDPDNNAQEFLVILTHANEYGDEEYVGFINLATLLSWGSAYGNLHNIIGRLN